MRRVVILRHARQRLDKPLYFLGAIAEVWRERGIEVLVMSGLAAPVEADLAILHIDLTRIPQPYLDAAARWPRVLNLRPHDISKRAISRHRVQPGDGYRGPVIIKTDANSAGEPEARLARSRSWMRRRWHKLRKRLPGVPGRQRLNYRIFASPDEVPAPVWRDPRLVVEQFRAERDGEDYCLRTWSFLGDADTHSLSWSRDPVIKSRNVHRREPLGEVPAQLCAFRAERGFDFGKFDYAVSGGEVVLYDANRTPALRVNQRKSVAASIRTLASGIDVYLKGISP